MFLPSIRFEIETFGCWCLDRGLPLQRCVNPISVEIVFELRQFYAEIGESSHDHTVGYEIRGPRPLAVETGAFFLFCRLFGFLVLVFDFLTRPRFHDRKRRPNDVLADLKHGNLIFAGIVFVSDG